MRIDQNGLKQWKSTDKSQNSDFVENFWLLKADFDRKRPQNALKRTTTSQSDNFTLQLKMRVNKILTILQ